MNGVFVDSNVIIHHLAGDNKAKEIIENVESGGDTGYINQIVVSEVIFICLRCCPTIQNLNKKKYI
jgi:predicted nucleic acid-binding protein